MNSYPAHYSMQLETTPGLHLHTITTLLPLTPRPPRCERPLVVARRATCWAVWMRSLR